MAGRMGRMLQTSKAMAASNPGSWGIWDWLTGPARDISADTSLGDKGYMSDYIKGQLGGVGGRTAPQMGGAQLDQSQSDEWRRRMIDLANSYGQIASGQEQGAGELAVGRAANQALANQIAMMNAQRGGQAAMAGRQAARGAVDIGQQAAGMGQEAALRDQAAARQALGTLGAQQRQMDLSAAGQNAQLEQNRQIAQMEADLRARGMNDQQILGLLSQLYGMNAAELQARLQAAGIQAGMPTNMQQIGQMAGGIGGLLTGFGLF